MFAELLRTKVSGIARLRDQQVEILEAHYQLLLRWNRVLNLTSVRSMEEAIERHYSESLFLAVRLPDEPLRVADVGSGAGFPGIPVAVMRPDCSVTLIEAHARKAVFLREATRRLNNVQVLCRRAEDLEDQFDFGISRAVSYADLRPILERIAKRACLLTGGEAPPADLGFEWEHPITVPWGRQRYLRMSVSRETGSGLFHVKH